MNIPGEFEGDSYTFVTTDDVLGVLYAGDSLCKADEAGGEWIEVWEDGRFVQCLNARTYNIVAKREG